MGSDKQDITLQQIAKVISNENGSKHKGNLVIRINNGEAHLGIVCMGGIIIQKKVKLRRYSLWNSIRISHAIRHLLNHTPPELVRDIDCTEKNYISVDDF